MDPSNNPPKPRELVARLKMPIPLSKICQLFDAIEACYGETFISSGGLGSDGYQDPSYLYLWRYQREDY